MSHKWTRVMLPWHHHPGPGPVSDSHKSEPSLNTMTQYNISAEFKDARVILPSATKLRQGNVLHLSAILFTGGGVSASVHAGIHPPGRHTPLGRQPPWADHPQVDTPPQPDTPLPPGQTPPGRHTPRADTQKPLWAETPIPLGRHPPWADTPVGRQPPPQQTPGQTPLPPANSYCSGRYAPYWNAFLFGFIVINC